MARTATVSREVTTSTLPYPGNQIKFDPNPWRGFSQGTGNMERRITAISVQKRDPQRVNIYLDGEFAFGLARIVAAWLQVGQTISEERIARLRAEDELEKAYSQALNLLSYRPRSESEIRHHLLDHEVPEAQIEATIERLRNAGLVDDQRFAHAWVENRNTHRPRGKRMLAYEMRQRGLEKSEIEQALENLDEEALAYQAARQKAQKLYHLEWAEFRTKLNAFLARRGFSYEISAPVVAQIWAELQSKYELEGNT